MLGYDMMICFRFKEEKGGRELNKQGEGDKRDEKEP